MQEQKRVRFYQTKAFRSLVAVALAIILLSNATVENMPSLFASEQEQEQAGEVQVPAQIEALAPKADSDQGKQSAAGDSAPDPTKNPDADATQEPGEEPDADATREPGEEPDADATQEPGEEPDASATPDPSGAPAQVASSDLIAQAIAKYGLTYVSVDGNLHSAPSLSEKSLLGRLSGTAVATAFYDADANQQIPAVIKLYFIGDQGEEHGYMEAKYAGVLDYDGTVEAIGEDAAGQYGSASWPLPLADFRAVEEERAPAKEESAPAEGEEESQQGQDTAELQRVAYDPQPETMEQVQAAIDAHAQARAISKDAPKPRWEFEVAPELMPSDYCCELVETDEAFGAPYYTYTKTIVLERMGASNWTSLLLTDSPQVPAIGTYDPQPATMEAVQAAIDAYVQARALSVDAVKPRWEFEVASELMPTGYFCALVRGDESFGAPYYTFFVSVTYDPQPTTLEAVQAAIDAYGQALTLSADAAKPRWAVRVALELMPVGYRCARVEDDAAFGAPYYTFFAGAPYDAQPATMEEVQAAIDAYGQALALSADAAKPRWEFRVASELMPTGYFCARVEDDAVFRAPYYTFSEIVADDAGPAYDAQPLTIEEVQAAIAAYEAAYLAALLSEAPRAALAALPEGKPHWEFVAAAELMPENYTCELVGDDAAFGAPYYTFFGKFDPQPIEMRQVKALIDIFNEDYQTAMKAGGFLLAIETPKPHWQREAPRNIMPANYNCQLVDYDEKFEGVYYTFFPGIQAMGYGGGNYHAEPPVGPSVMNSFTLVGNAHVDAQYPNIAITTLDVTNQIGAMWNKEKLDLSLPFETKMSLYLSHAANKTATDDVADGMAFVLHNDAQGASAIGYQGEGIAVYGLTDAQAIQYSLAVEFDTYYNASGTVSADPSSSAHCAVVETKTAKKVNSADHKNTFTFAREHKWHLFTAKWTPSWNGGTLSGTLEYTFDGISKSYTVANVLSTFNNSTMVYWGFTGSTGGNTAVQAAALTQLPEQKAQLNGTKKVTQNVGAPGETFQFRLTGAAGSPMPSGSTGQVFDFSSKAGAFDIANITFSKKGTYTYMLEEIPGSTEGFTYDPAKYEITASVTEGTSAFIVQFTYKKDGNTVAGIEFNNTYKIPTDVLGGQLTWVNDAGYVSESRPGSAWVQLYRQVPGGQPVAVGSPVEVTGTGDVWGYSFGAQDRHDTSGKVYTYTVQQVNPNLNYTVTPSGLNLTDTLHLASFSGKKIWDLRSTFFSKPASIDVEVWRSGVLLKTITVNAVAGQNTWPYTVDGLLEFDKNNVAYTYTVKEADASVAPGIVPSVSGTEITNYGPPDKEIKVKVEWNHGDAEASVITAVETAGANIHLYKGGSAFGLQRLVKSPWTHSFFINVVAYGSGGFTIVQDKIPGYTLTYRTEADGTLVAINTYAPVATTVDVKLTKSVTTGVGAPDVDFNFAMTAVTAGAPMPGGKTSPLSITGKAGTIPVGTITYAKAGTYVYEFVEKAHTPAIEGFAYDANKITMTVTVTDANVDGNLSASAVYATTAVGVPPPTSVSFSNPYAIPLRTIRVELEWADSNNALGGRPSAAEIKLYRKTASGGIELVPGGTVQMTATGATGPNGSIWVYEFKNQPVHSTGGETYAYSVEQSALPYTKNYTITYDPYGAANPDTATLLHIKDTVKTTFVTLTKKWDIVGSGYTKPANVLADVYRHTAAAPTPARVVQNASIPAVAGSDTWTLKVDNLLEFDRDSGAPYVFTVKELGMPSYIDTTVDAGNALTLINAYRADIDKKVRVVWDHTGAPQATRKAAEQAGVTVTLKGDGNDIIFGGGPIAKLLSDAGTADRPNTGTSWAHTFKVPYMLAINLSSYNAEGSAVAGYAKSATVYDKATDTYTITYTFIKLFTQVQVTKEWNNKPAGVPYPASLRINLFRSGDAVNAFRSYDIPSAAIGADGKASYTFVDLPRYDDDGIEYVYTSQEVKPSGYTQSASGHNFINTYAPTAKTFDVSFSKSVTSGVGAPNVDFNFTMTAVTAGAPMPGGKASPLSITGKAGTIPVGTITFTMPGTYVYEFVEKAHTPAIEGFTYDTNKITMTVTVTDASGNGNLAVSAAYASTSATEPTPSGVKFANVYSIPLRTIRVELEWADSNNALGGRPSAAYIKLYRSTASSGGPEQVDTNAPVALTGSGATWTYDFKNMPVHSTSGEQYTYSVVQTTKPYNYSIAYNPYGAANPDTATLLHIKDTIVPTSITVTKKWNIVGRGYTKPANVLVDVYRHTAAAPTPVRVVQNVSIPAVAGSDTWTLKVDNLLQYDRDTGASYIFTVKELGMPAHIDTTVDSADALTLINTYRADIDKKVRVVWDHTGAPQAVRKAAESAGATVTLQGNGADLTFEGNLIEQPLKDAGTADRPNTGTSWPHTFKVPYMIAIGVNAYAVRATDVAGAVAGEAYTYSKSINYIAATDTFEVTYTYVMAKVDVSGVKNWIIGYSNVMRPAVTIDLYRDGAPTTSYFTIAQDTPYAVGTTANAYAFTGLDKYRPDGTAYVYTTEEREVAGFNQHPRDAAHPYDFTNEYDPLVAVYGAEATKIVSGEKGAPPTETFTFTMAFNSGPAAKMPAAPKSATPDTWNLQGNTLTVKTVAGPVTFGNIAFDVKGTYTYTIKETAGGNANFAYDGSSYTLAVTVVGEDRLTVSNVAITKNGAGAPSAVVFDNAYTVPTTALSGKLTWVDESDALGGRPGSATVELWRTSANVPDGERVMTVTTTDPNPAQPSDVWAYDFGKQPDHDDRYAFYTYSVRQAQVDKNYKSAATPNTLDLVDTLETISVKGQKVWDIQGSRGFTRPDATGVLVELYRSDDAGNAYRSATVKPVTGQADMNVWDFEFKPLLRYDPAGDEYAYTVNEATTLTAVDTAYNGTVITNTYAADETLTVEVTWNQTGAPPSRRPASVQVTLYHSSDMATPLDSKTVTEGADGRWVCTFDVPQLYARDGQLVVTQNDLSPDYATTHSPSAATAYKSIPSATWTIHNAFVMTYQAVQGGKSWLNKPAAYPKPEVWIDLYRTSVNVQPEWVAETKVTAGDTYSFGNQPDFDPQGEPYTYTVSERTPSGYTSKLADGSARNLVNTYAPTAVTYTPTAWGLKRVTGTGAPNETFNFTLTLASGDSQHVKYAKTPQGGAVHATAKAGESFDFGAVTFGYPGVYTFRIAETKGTTEGFLAGYDPAVYTLTVTVDDKAFNGALSLTTALTKDPDGPGSEPAASAASVEFTNRYAMPTRDKTVTINWNDAGYAAESRPDSVTLQLYRRTSEFAPWTAVSNYQVQVSANGTDAWQHIFTGLPLHDDSYTFYTYAVAEVDLNRNYTVSEPYAVENNNAMSITNNLQLIGVSGVKQWDLVTNQVSRFTKPADIQIDLLRNGAGFGHSLAVNDTMDGDPADDAWGFTFTNLLAYDKTDKPYTYTVFEPNVPAACTESYNGMTVTNTVGADKILTIRADWNYTGAPQADRPAGVTVKLTRDGSQYGQLIQLNAGTAWEAKIVVPLEDYLHSAFSIEEFLPDARLIPLWSIGYDQGKSDVDTYVAKNVYMMQGVDVTVVKQWDNVPPSVITPSVTVELYHNSVAPANLLGAVNLTSPAYAHTFPGLDRYDANGDTYVFIAVEHAITGYTEGQELTVDGADKKTITITNTYTPIPVSMTVKGDKLRSGDAAPAGTEVFHFELEALDAGNPMPQSGDVRATAGTGAVNFGDIVFTYPGTYVYEITEVADTNAHPYMTFDATVVTATVTVTDPNHDGRLAATLTYDYGTVQDAQGFAFANVYTTPVEDVTVIVDWVDRSDALALRPASTGVRLYRSVDGGVTKEELTHPSVTAPAAAIVDTAVTGNPNRWTLTFPDLPVHDKDGKYYAYSVTQEADAARDINYSERITGLAITNTLLSADVSAVKSSTPAPNKPGDTPVVMDGDTITYTVAVTNSGARPAYNTFVFDTVARGLTPGNYSHTPAQVTVNADGSTSLRWDFPRIATGAAETITFDVTVGAQFSGSFTNIAGYRVPETAGEQPDSGTADGTVTDPVAHQRITLTKAADPAPNPSLPLVEGQEVTYTITVDAPAQTSGITVTDRIPDGMTLASGSISGNGTYDDATRTVTWADQDIQGGANAFSFKVTVDRFTGAFTRDFTNAAAVTVARATGNSTLLSNRVTHTATRRAVTIDKSVALEDEGGQRGAYQQGTPTSPIETQLEQTIWYRLDVRSQGYMPGGTLFITDKLHGDVAYAGTMVFTPSGNARMTFIEPGAANDNTATWVISGLGLDESFTIEFNATAPVTSDNPKTPGKEHTKVFENAAKLTDNALKALVGPRGGLYTADEYEKTSNSTFNAVYESDLIGRKTSTPASPNSDGVIVLEGGDTITYAIEIANIGDRIAKRSRVMDFIPEGVRYVSSSPQADEIFTDSVTGEVVALMWLLPDLDVADAGGNPTPAGTTSIGFTVEVKDPDAATLIDNVAYFRLSENNEPFPARAGVPDDLIGYISTKETVQHQTYTFDVATSPAGDVSRADATSLIPGQPVIFTGTLHSAAEIKDVRVEYPVPEGFLPVLGSIRIIGADGQSTPVSDDAYDPATGILSWPATAAMAGETRFEATLLVGRLDISGMNREFETIGTVSMSNSNGGTVGVTTSPVYHKTSVGFTDIAKTAALIEKDGTIEPEDAGTQTAPVMGLRGQQLEYRLTVTRTAGVGNKSGQIIVTDALPKDMTLTPGSITGTITGAGRIVSMSATTVTDVDGVNKPGVQWILADLEDGSEANLAFRAKLPISTDDPATPEVETSRIVPNTARAVDTALRDMKYPGAVSGHEAGTNLYAPDEYDRPTNTAYHRMLGPNVIAKLSSVVAPENRVYENNTITYFIELTNIGEIAADNVLVKDTLNSILRYVENSQSSDKADTEFVRLGQQTLAWILPKLEVNETVIIKFRAKVARMEVIGTRFIPNVAQVTEATPDGNPTAELLSANTFKKTNEVKHFQRMGASILVRKVDAATGERLANAEFCLQQIWAPTPYDKIEDMFVTTNSDGEARFDDLPIGKYVVIEVSAPSGYSPSPIRRSVDIIGDRGERSIVVPNHKLVDIQEVGVPNAGAASRNVGDCPY